MNQRSHSRKLFSLEKIAVFTVAAFFTVELASFGKIPTPTFQIIQNSQSPRVVAQATRPARIYFTPSEIVADTTVAQTTTNNASLYADTGGKNIGKIEVHMGYNPNSLQKVSFFPDSLSGIKYTMSQNIDSQKGHIDYALAIVPDKNSHSTFPQVFRLGTVSFQVAQAAAAGSQTLSFLPTTAIYLVTNSSVASFGVRSSSQSILDQTIPLTIITTSR